MTAPATVSKSRYIQCFPQRNTTGAGSVSKRRIKILIKLKDRAILCVKSGEFMVFPTKGVASRAHCDGTSHDVDFVRDLQPDTLLLMPEGKTIPYESKHEELLKRA